MICPICGAEASGEVCTTCGARISGTSSFSLQGGANVGTPTPTYNDIQQPVMEDFSDLESQPYNMGMGGNMNGYPSYGSPAPKKSKSGAIAGIIVAVVLLAVVGVICFNIVMSKKAIKECEKVIDNFITGMEEGDSEKLVSIIDPDATGGMDAESMEELGAMMSLVLAMGAEFDIYYTIEDRTKATESQIKSMCADLYGDAGMSKEIGRAYVFELDIAMSVSFMGETQSDSQTTDLLCYEKDGNYYMWTEDTDIGLY